jgi:DNA-directed RNA polymerase subunit K/omega
MIKETRASEVDVEKCIAKTGFGRFDLVVAAAQRVRELKIRARESGQHISAVDALLEAQNGRLNVVDYLAKVK